MKPRELSYDARAQIADNLLLLRRRAGYSQEVLAERALVSTDRIGCIERGRPGGMFDTYVRLAGSLSVSLDDLLAGVRWIPATVESEYKAGYKVIGTEPGPDDCDRPQHQARAAPLSPSG